jgi:outer membrane usher protein
MIRRYAIAMFIAIVPVAGAFPAGATTPAKPQDVAAAAESQQRVYAVTINGDVVSQGSVVLVGPTGSVLVSGEDLQRWRFVMTGKVPRSTLDGQLFYALGDFPGLTVRIDEARQILEINAPGSLFSLTTLDNLYDSRGNRIVNRSRGGFLNYALTGARFGGSSFEQGLFEAGMAGVRGGVLTTSVAWSPNSNSTHFARVATKWERTLLESRSTLRIGDVVSSPGRLGGSVPMAGIQYASDFATDPEFATSADLEIRGIAPSASTVDVLVNNLAYITGQRVATGPFVLKAPAFGLDGQGQVRVIVRDAFGNDHVIVQSFYGSRQLLKKGLSEFSYEAGLQRQDFGSGFSSYRKPVVAGTLRRGFANSFTGEAHVEAASGVEVGEFTADLAVPRLGLLSAGIATSFSPAGTGVRALLGAQYQARSGFAVSANVTGANASFRTIGTDIRSGVSEQVYASVPFRKLYFSGGFLSSRQGGRTTSFATFGLSGRLAGGSLSLSATQGINGAPGSYYAGYTARIGRTTVNTSATSTRIIASAQNDPPASGYGASTGISVSKEPGSGAFLGGTYAFESPIVHFDASADRDAVFANVRGGLMFVAGKVAPARELVGSYGLAIVPGYPNVRVSVNGIDVGRTDRNGAVALPFLTPYNVNRIAVEQSDLPISANFPTLVETAIPYYRSATIVRFNPGVAGGVVIHLRLADGSAVPAGSQVRGLNGAANSPVVEDGVTYLPALPPGNAHFTAAIGGDGTCTFAIDVPRDTSAIPDLGNVRCVGGASSSPTPTPTPGPSPPPVPSTAVAAPANASPSPMPVTPHP